VTVCGKAHMQALYNNRGSSCMQAQNTLLQKPYHLGPGKAGPFCRGETDSLSLYRVFPAPQGPFEAALTSRSRHGP